jgi:hypothetical protein
MNSRRTSNAVFAIVGVVVIALAVAVGLHAGRAHTTAVSSSTAAPVTSATAPATPAPVAATTAAVSSSAPVSTTSAAPSAPPNYAPIAEDATKEKGLDFGFLTKVTDANGVVTLTFDRAYFYTGAEAAKHNKGVEPDDDYLVVDDNLKLRAFNLDQRASIQAESGLRNDSSVGRETLTRPEFIHNFEHRYSGYKAIAVWVRHTGGPDGPVTALAEQYIP